MLVATDFGGALLLSHGTIVKTTQGAQTSFQDGLLAFAVSTEGKILWRQPIRHCEVSDNPQYFHQELISDGNNVHVIHNGQPFIEPNFIRTDKMALCGPVVQYLRGGAIEAQAKLHEKKLITF